MNTPSPFVRRAAAALVWFLVLVICGAPSSALALGSAIYGDGSDGNVTISADTTLTRDMYYDTLTVAPGVNLDTAGFRIFVKVRCTINGTIRNNGGFAGAGARAGTTGGGGAAGESVEDSAGGDGGGGSGSPGPTATPPAAEHGGVEALRALPYAITGTLVWTGGASRIRGGAGGGFVLGGGGGGVVIIAAKVFAGTGRIEAIGGAGGSGNFVGTIVPLGGGGGGGVIVTVSGAATLGRIVTSVAGGRGAGSGLGDGQPGMVFHLMD